jgi:hypothetical protein
VKIRTVVTVDVKWRPDCGGDWTLSGPNFFANYWPDNTVTASVFDGDPETSDPIASMGVAVPFSSRAECMAEAEKWIRSALRDAGLTGKAAL